MNQQSAKKFFEEHKIRYVLAQFVDIHGAAKAKAVPVEHLEMVLTDGAGFAGFALWGFGMGPEGPDYMAVGDLSTLQDIPWMPGYARIICNGVVNKKSYPYCSRVALQAQIARLTERGLTLYTGIEPEFMLLSRRADGSLGPADPTDDLDKPCYDYKGLFRTREVLDEMVAGAARRRDRCLSDRSRGRQRPVRNQFHLCRCAQVRGQLHLRQDGRQRDRAQARHDATFMPKPFANRAGSGAHFHVSVGSAKQKNAFYDQDDKSGMGLSAMAYHFLGGVLEACTRALRRRRADRELLQAPGRRPRPVGRHLGSRPTSPTATTTAPPACACRTGASKSGCRIPGCNPYLVSAAIDRRGARRHRQEARSGSGAEHQPVPAVARGIGRQGNQAAAAVPATRPSTRSSRMR